MVYQFLKIVTSRRWHQSWRNI